MTRPFSLLIKPTSADCNLRCAYCFYLDRSALYPEESIHRMSDEVLEEMIARYMATEQPQYIFGWQGGEPTLMGLEFFEKVVYYQKKHAKPGAVISNGLQTNGTLLTEEFAKFLHEYQFLVGVSLDGPKELHDQYRVNQGMAGTHDRVWEGIQLLQKHQVDFNILTLVNSVNVHHAKEIYQYLKDHGFYYQQYIPCVELDETGNPLPFTITGEEWGRFLIEIFDEWIQKDPYRVSIRTFDSLLSFMMEGWTSVCHMGGNCCQYFVVEYNGDIYPCDFFVDQERKIGNITQDTWEEMQKSPKYQSFGQFKNQWNKKCLQCPHLLYCSGDCLKHRIYNECPPQTLSWLCQGWEEFFDHAIQPLERLAREAKQQRQSEKGIGKSQPVSLYIDQKHERNASCFCGSGKKYKYCHGYQ
ncbi:MAG: anaerobic sulfatase maturase [Epulopiscium sp.]|nr:anaerobic sulfatase maturase [Candidatus Epulonipiscium sp.]